MNIVASNKMVLRHDNSSQTAICELCHQPVNLSLQ